MPRKKVGPHGHSSHRERHLMPDSPPRKKIRMVFKHEAVSSAERKLRAEVLSRLALADAQLAVKSQTALSHFIAVVKELEDLMGFHFEEFQDGEE